MNRSRRPEFTMMFLVLAAIVFSSNLSRLDQAIRQTDRKIQSIRSVPESKVEQGMEDSLLQKFYRVKSVLLKGYRLPEDYIVQYYARRIEPTLSRPHFQGPPNPEFLYRGMYLNPDELQVILENGMPLSRVKWTSAGGGISFSSDVNEAATYIFQSANQRSNGIGVVFKVRKSAQMTLANDPVLNRTKTIYKKQADVHPSEMVNVYLWGQYGLESLDEIQMKIRSNRIVPAETWTGVFSSGIQR